MIDWTPKLVTRVRQQVISGRRRARIEGTLATLTLAEWRAILERADGRCTVCGAAIGTPALEIDHIVGFAAGGPHTAANVRPACLPCNRQRPSPRRSQSSGKHHKRPKHDHATVGWRVWLMRGQAELNQKQLAAQVGLCVQRISLIERGRLTPDASMLQRFAVALGVSLDYLAGRDTQVPA